MWSASSNVVSEHEIRIDGSLSVLNTETIKLQIVDGCVGLYAVKLWQTRKYAYVCLGRASEMVLHPVLCKAENCKVERGII
jgi:hypothetical protein